MQSVELAHSVEVHERRRYPRIKATVPVEFVPEGAATATHATTSDISCSGCYVEMNFTLPIGTRLEMTLWLGTEKIYTSAVVATHHPYFGNGIEFLEMSPADVKRLDRFMHSALCHMVEV